MRHIFELLGCTSKAFYHIRLGQSLRSDLLWWLTFMEEWNSVALLKTGAGVPSYHIWSDASGRIGCGAVEPASQKWFQLRWGQHDCPGSAGASEESITLKELLPIVIACAVWGASWMGSAIMVYCDNTRAVAAVNSSHSHVPNIMHLLRCLFFIRAHFDLSVRAEHVPGVQNTWADAISRDNLRYFLSQVPGAADKQCTVPCQLVPLLIGQRPDRTSPAWTRLLRASVLPD